MHKESIYKRYEPAVTDPNETMDQAYWFAFASNKMLVKEEISGYSVPFAKELSSLNIPSIRTQYLGKLLEQPCYSAELVSEECLPEGMAFVELRALYGNIDEDLFLLAGKAYQVVSWDQTHQFCGRCGSSTEDLSGERAKVCPKCGFISYPRICPAVITAITKEDKILLAHAKHFKEGMYSLIAGFVEAGETLEEGVQREIMEEVGIKVKNIQYLGSQPWPFPNSMMLGFTAEYESGEIIVDGVEITEANWYDTGNLPGLPPEVSIARKIINRWINSQNPNKK
jgi:NAD+ diphosphatase